MKNVDLLTAYVFCVVTFSISIERINFNFTVNTYE